MFRFSLVEFSIRRQKRVIWATVALALLFLTQFPRIATDTNPKHMLPENSDVRVWNDEVDRDFALYEDTIVVGVQNDAGVLNRETLARVARITGAILALPGVASRDVNGFTTITNVTAEAGTLKVGPLMTGTPQTDTEVETLRTALFGKPPYSATAGSSRTFILYKRYVTAATGENPIVTVKITDEFEVLPETCVIQHAPGVTAHRENTPGLNLVMAVEGKTMRMIGYRAAIDHCLPIILAGGFQPVQFE